MSLLGYIVTDVGSCSEKEVIATQAITFLFLPRILCLSPRQILSSKGKDAARRRLLVPASFPFCGGSASKPLSSEARISYILLLTEAHTLYGPSGTVRHKEEAARRRLLGTASSLLLTVPYALLAASHGKLPILYYIINLNPSNIQG